MIRNDRVVKTWRVFMRRCEWTGQVTTLNRIETGATAREAEDKAAEREDAEVLYSWEVKEYDGT